MSPFNSFATRFSVTRPDSSSLLSPYFVMCLWSISGIGAPGSCMSLLGRGGVESINSLRKNDGVSAVVFLVAGFIIGPIGCGTDDSISFWKLCSFGGFSGGRGGDKAE